MCYLTNMLHEKQKVFIVKFSGRRHLFHMPNVSAFLITGLIMLYDSLKTCNKIVT